MANPKVCKWPRVCRCGRGPWRKGGRNCRQCHREGAIRHILGGHADLRPYPSDPPTAHQNTTMRGIEKVVCHHFNIHPENLHLRTRERGGEIRAIVVPRQIIMLLTRELTYQSLPQIGAYFGKDHTTILSGVRRIRSLVQTNPKVAEHVAACRARLPCTVKKLAAYRADAERLRNGLVSWPVDCAPPGL